MVIKTIGDAIKARRMEMNLSQEALAEMANLNRITVSKYESGRVEPGASALGRIAAALEMSADDLLGLTPPVENIPYIPLVRNAVPIVGSIACGTPILAEQNIDGYISTPEGVQADFALRCAGDSMVPTFADGDLVLIRQTPDVNDGRIAAVLIDQDATLKRVHHLADGIMLNPDNQASYSPIILREESAADVHILGEAVAYVRTI